MNTIIHSASTSLLYPYRNSLRRKASDIKSCASLKGFGLRLFPQAHEIRASCHNILELHPSKEQRRFGGSVNLCLPGKRRQDQREFISARIWRTPASVEKNQLSALFVQGTGSFPSVHCFACNPLTARQRGTESLGTVTAWSVKGKKKEERKNVHC